MSGMNAKKYIAKLLLAVSFSALAFALLAGATYAWFVLSTQPEARGAKVTVGAKNTIQVAANITGDNGEPAPGDWNDYIQLDARGLSSLSPVSTVDGEHWIVPVFADLEDGGAMSFEVRQAGMNAASTADGYAYLDFWVKAPEACKLRVSTEFLRGEPGQKYLAGSFVVAVPEVAEEDGSYVLNPVDCAAAACVRLGFLTNGEEGSTRFTIYEPNADYHPGDSEDHSYHITQPLDENGNPVDLKTRLSVQLSPVWRDNRNRGFQTQLTPANISTVAEAQDFLTESCLRYVPEWLIAGHFFHNTAALYTAAGESSGVSAENMAALTMGGATEDVWICTLAADTPVRIRLFIWLEGTDSDCVDCAAAADLLIRLELAGDTTG